MILDNPVYCGKIAYGRGGREKGKGTKNEYKQIHTDDYILEDGQHEGIVSEELWQKAHTKRMATGIKQPSKIGKDRSHLLTGILKCPLCGSSMYTNKHAWTNKDGTYKEVSIISAEGTSRSEGIIVITRHLLEKQTLNHL